jgi:CubicO group peptidase (beta-lactamase class C family)
MTDDSRPNATKTAHVTIRPARRHVMAGVAALATLPLASVTKANAQIAAQTDPGRAARALAVARRVMAAPPLSPPALSIAVANPNGVIWAQALGSANLESGVAATPAHSFRLGSVSKPLTTTAAARLVSRRLLDLDAPISTWLPDLPGPHRQTTLRQLFTHRGGVRHYLPKDFDPKTPGGPIYQRSYPGNSDILAVFIEDPLVGPVGGQVSYSSFGYTLASMVMEAAAKQSFTQLMAAEIGKTFDLPSLAIDDPLAIVPLRATGYSNAIDLGLVSKPAADFFYPGRSSGWFNMPYFNPAYAWAAGGYLMSASDTARFGAALLESPSAKITQEERALLFTPLTQQAGAMPPLGLGWRIDTDAKGRRRFHHAGSTMGGRANLMLYPDQGLAIAIASNVLAVPGNVLQPSADLADIFA